mmetsp:Transcript_4044/g.9642  ORF Transcript_4044/g.9642 Transcript_4044/m.9642 type:complete len:234 (+) Transcript_4044:1020-1721(+)
MMRLMMEMLAMKVSNGKVDSPQQQCCSCWHHFRFLLFRFGSKILICVPFLRLLRLGHSLNRKHGLELCSPNDLFSTFQRMLDPTMILYPTMARVGKSDEALRFPKASRAQVVLEIHFERQRPIYCSLRRQFLRLVLCHLCAQCPCHFRRLSRLLLSCYYPREKLNEDFLLQSWQQLLRLARCHRWDREGGGCLRLRKKDGCRDDYVSRYLGRRKSMETKIVAVTETSWDDNPK